MWESWDPLDPKAYRVLRGNRLLVHAAPPVPLVNRSLAQRVIQGLRARWVLPGYRERKAQLGHKVLKAKLVPLDPLALKVTPGHLDRPDPQVQMGSHVLTPRSSRR